MFSYRLLVMNIRHNRIYADLKELKQFIKDHKIGDVKLIPSKRIFTFDDIDFIMNSLISKH